eukprot:INCI5941.7.p1 GENE.INCI5941.7~~INCI5941.7.p1  ORF type:complete len:895 (-),score=111.07 INCI5941.7:505-3048(-)
MGNRPPPRPAAQFEWPQNRGSLRANGRATSEKPRWAGEPGRCRSCPRVAFTPANRSTSLAFWQTQKLRLLFTSTHRARRFAQAALQLWKRQVLRTCPHVDRLLNDSVATRSLEACLNTDKFQTECREVTSASSANNNRTKYLCLTCGTAHSKSVGSGMNAHHLRSKQGSSTTAISDSHRGAPSDGAGFGDVCSLFCDSTLGLWCVPCARRVSDWEIGGSVLENIVNIIRREPDAMKVRPWRRKLKSERKTLNNAREHPEMFEQKLRITAPDAPTTDKLCGIVYDARMVKHKDIPGCEVGLRIVQIAKQLQREGLLPHKDTPSAAGTIRVPSREATDAELLAVHTKMHVDTIDSLKNMDARTCVELEHTFNSIALNPSTSLAARLAAGSLTELCLRVATERSLANGFAAIRPPGHHCESALPYGFCVFSNVAVAIREVQRRAPQTRVLVVDWDVHHGNSTQHQFWHDDRVLYFSTHRYDNTAFFPCAVCADMDRVGDLRDAPGTNCNVPFDTGGETESSQSVGDPEYMYIWERLLIPLGKAFHPDLVIVSAGFDSALGDPLGGFCVTPNAFAHMTRALQQLAEGRVVLALEGGYNLTAISASAAACVEALIARPLPDLVLQRSCHPKHRRTIEDCIEIHQQFLLKVGASCVEGAHFNDHNERVGTSLNVPGVVLDSSGGGDGGGAANADGATCAEALHFLSMASPGRVMVPMGSGGYGCFPINECPHCLPGQFIQPVEAFIAAEVSWTSECCHKDCANDGNLVAPHTAQGVQHDIWLCMQCMNAGCGRAAQGHALRHREQGGGHPISLSFADFSFWCYECDSYVVSQHLDHVQRLFHKQKFGYSPPSA